MAESIAGEPGTTDNYAICRSSGAANAGSAASASYALAGGSWGQQPSGKQIQALSVATVRFTIDDMIVTGVGNSAEIHLNLVLSGEDSRTSEALTGTVAGRASASIQLTVTIKNHQEQLRRWFTTRVTAPDPPEMEEVYNDPELDVPLPATISIGPYTVSLNQPFEVEVNMYTYASAQFAGINGGSGESEAWSDYGSTLHFPIAGPVFTLPAGLTTSSVSAGVVDNAWTGTPAQAAAVRLPEPGLALSQACALVALCLARRRHRFIRPYIHVRAC